MKNILISLLTKRAKALVNKFEPKVIAITGSVGKTTTRNAIFQVLEPHITVRTAKKNYNNEIGVPLAILGKESPGSSLFGWMRLLLSTYFVKSFPRVLVLEYGADHPGDIDYLCSIAKPDIAVVTGVSPVHAEFFASIDDLAEEKSSLVKQVSADGVTVLNADNMHVMGMAKKAPGRVKTYGLKSHDLGVRNIRIVPKHDERYDAGEVFVHTTADIVQKEAVLANIALRNCIGYAPIMACLAAISVAQEFDIAIDQAVETLEKTMQPGMGRLRPIAGIKGSLIIDDSYNAAPAAMQNGLQILRMFEPGEEYDRRIAVLGSMAELGQYTESEHRMIGMQVVDAADMFIGVGASMKVAVQAAKEAGMKEDAIQWFETSIEAGRYLDGVIQEGDIVYVKGAQSSRMEKVVKDVMAEPLRAAELLVRQDKKWLQS